VGVVQAALLKNRCDLAVVVALSAVHPGHGTRFRAKYFAAAGSAKILYGCRSLEVAPGRKDMRGARSLTTEQKLHLISLLTDAPIKGERQRNTMSHIGSKHPSYPDLVAAAHADEGSSIRSRDEVPGARPRQDSTPDSKLEASARSRRSHSSTRPAAGSLDDRLEKKMLVARELMKDLPSTDTRVRLLHVAIMRRDETLLDGVLAELNKLL
jgi:hypothetical protein